MLFDRKEIEITGKLIKFAKIKDEWFEDAINPNFVIKQIKEANLRADIFTFLQRLPETQPKYNYHLEWDNAAVIQIISFDHWWTHQITKNNRKRVRKARNRGVELKLSDFNNDFVEGIMNIYNESPIRQGKRFWHYGKDFETVKNENSTFMERADFIGAYCNNELIGFIKLVYIGKCAVMMQILSKIESRDKFTNNALIAKAVEICAEKKIPFLIYGKFFYGKKGSDTLNIFKIRNGFQKIDIPRYYIPLSIKGKLVLKLRLHHNLSEIIPKCIMVTFLDIREKWYQIKYSNQKEKLEEN